MPSTYCVRSLHAICLQQLSYCFKSLGNISTENQKKIININISISISISIGISTSITITITMNMNRNTNTNTNTNTNINEY